MDPLRNEGTDLPISHNTTVEDILDFQKSHIQTFLRVNHLKVSGNKLELAQRVVDAIKARSCMAQTSSIPTHISCQNSGIPDIKDLHSGWAGKSDMFPKIKIKDVENYLIHSSHRTVDAKKMQCYRQYIRGLNFFKEGYIHKMMMNEINPDCEFCYIRSKCYFSMKQGVYEQWILMTKKPPFHVQKASCTCPAGLGEGCTHVAGLLFALEGRPVTEDDVPCTSKPCEWNRPSKRKKDTKPVQDMSFKKIKLSGENVKKKKTVNYNVDSIKFRNSLCAKLGNNSRAAIFYILPPYADNNINVQYDLNIAHFEEVETSDHILHLSDKHIALQKTVQDENMSQSDFLTFISTCSQEIVNEIEVRTKGQHNNPLWVSARAARITASNFHEQNKKDSTKSENIISRLMGQGKPLENNAVHWGIKQEPIAKKRYKAYMKLKKKPNFNVEDMGLVLCAQCSYIGASPDGLVKSDTERYLLEVKCSYKWRQSTILEACKDKTFCCYVDDTNTIQLKKSHKYYTQVQGQMGVCQMERCDFVIYTVKDFLVIPIKFDRSFWESLLTKLKSFYIEELFPKLKN